MNIIILKEISDLRQPKHVAFNTKENIQAGGISDIEQKNKNYPSWLLGMSKRVLQFLNISIQRMIFFFQEKCNLKEGIPSC